MIDIIMIFILSNNTVCKYGKVVYTECRPIIDGMLSENCWADAYVINDFVQLMPKRGEIPTESTKVYLLYDSRNIYIGIKCFDDPKQIKANTKIRDHEKIAWDDGIGIFLSADNKNEGYAFLLNAIGTQRDIRISEGGNSSFPEWDGDWNGKVMQTKEGWEAEIMIPFRIINFDKDDSIWSFNFLRGITRKIELISWCNLSNQGRIDEWGKISGIDTKKVFAIGSNRNFKFSPYWSLFLKGKDIVPKLGIETLRIDFLNVLRAEFTLYPDYAHIEADIDEFDLDKLPQWLPEKRPFFIEDLGMFDTPITLLYTRSISNIKGGTKVITQLPGLDCGLLGILLDTTSKEMTFTGRVKKSTNWCNLGFLGIQNYAPENRILGIDASFNLPKQIYLSGQGAKSWQEENESNILYYLLLKRTLDFGLNFTAHYKYIPTDFVDVRGYIPMTDLISKQISLSPKFQINRWIIRDFSIGTGYVNWQTTAHNKIKESVWGRVSFGFLKNIFSSLSYTDEERIYNAERYFNKLWTYTISYLRGGMSSVNFSFVYGDYWGGILYYPSANLNFTLFKNFTNSLVLDYQILQFPDATSDTALIFVYIPCFNLCKNMNLRSFIQWSDKSDILVTNFLLDWTFFKWSKLYIALNRTETLTNEEEPSWVFFIKVSSNIWF